MSVYIHTPPDMFQSRFDHLQGLLSVLGMATKNVASNWLAFTSSMWLYLGHLTTPEDGQILTETCRVEYECTRTF
jgi:hypothetical protein